MDTILCVAVDWAGSQALPLGLVREKKTHGSDLGVWVCLGTPK